MSENTRRTPPPPVGRRRHRDSGDGQIGGGGAPVHDPGLERLTHFLVTVGDPVYLGTRGGYSTRTHKYKDSFVNPKGYELHLNAREGLIAYRYRRIAAVKRRTKPRLGRDVEGWLDERNGDLAPPGDGPPLYPPELHAFVWTVNEVRGSGFNSRNIVDRRKMPMELGAITIPGPGTYDISLRAVTIDNRYFERTNRVTIKEWFIASIGDSSASGEGNPMRDGTAHPILGRPFCEGVTISKIIDKKSVNMNNRVEWLEKEAHRSLTSGPAIAAQMLDSRYARSRRGSIHRVDAVTFVTVARSGAEIIDGLLHSQIQPPSSDFVGHGQVDELVETANGRTIDVLMINIGGNDAGFSGVLEDLVKGDSYFSLGLSKALFQAVTGIGNAGDDAAARRDMKKRLTALLAVGGQIEDDFDLLKSKIDALAPRAVYITGYPVWLFEDSDGSFKADGIFSGPDMSITPADYREILAAGSALNDLIKRKAGQFNWHYVPPSTEFRRRGYSSKRPLWQGATSSCLTQGDFDGTMHPNDEGAAAWALQFATEIRRHTMT
ncbi:GDSL-type esterase/lipase family protein [Ornithinimicrobium cerasi]|uniref:GDSL-type esterase/lipase family protein n=1 Tax=Ornithinimicrobium cerasi TaxID=2248773 RepID=UPI000EFFB9CD|nr:GDSL-type esterase/lipase family protein [Ornithinimicrobium cerasi]